MSSKKFTDSELKGYAGSVAMISKKKLIAGITAATLLVGTGAGLATYFGIKASTNGFTNGNVYINPVKEKDADISITTNGSGDKVATVSSAKSGRMISDVEVTIGSNILKQGEEYTVDSITSNGGSTCIVTIKKEAINKYSGAVYVNPVFKDEVAVVVFNSNGGTAVEVKQVKVGSTIDAPKAPTKENYEFDGWYEDEGLTKEFNFGKTKITQNITLYAKWDIPETKEGLYYEYLEPLGGYIVSGSFKKLEERENLPALLRIPDEHEGLPVVAIRESAFRSCKTIKEVIIGKNVAWIAPDAFSDCSCLKKVSFEGNKVSYIGNGAFEYCNSLSEIELKEGLMRLGYSAFRYCTALNSIKLPNSLYIIPEGCFEYCTGLETVVLGENVTKIGDGEDHDAEGTLTEEDVAHAQLVTRKEALSENEFVKAREGLVFDNLKDVGHVGGAFERCTSLKNINIPESVTEISWNAFNECRSLTSSTCVFCDELSGWIDVYNDELISRSKYVEVLKHGGKIVKEAITVEDSEYKNYLSFQYSGTETDKEGNIHYYCTISLSERAILPASGIIEIPETISYAGKQLEIYKIADSGFTVDDTEMQIPAQQYKIILPSTLEHIGDRSFMQYDSDCFELFSSVSFKNNKSSLLSIGNYAFTNCNINSFNSSIDGVLNIPEGTLKLGANAFSMLYESILHQSQGLTKAIIPSTIEEIPTELLGTNDFMFLPEANAIKNPDYIFSYPFFGSKIQKVEVDSKNKYYVSDELYNLYSKGDDGKYFELISLTNYTNGKYTIQPGTKSINDVAFMNPFCFDIYQVDPLKTVKFSEELEAVNGSFYYHKKYGNYLSGLNYSLTDVETNGSDFYFDDTNIILYNKDKTILITSLNYLEEKTKFVIPNTVKILSNGAFMNNGYTGNTLSLDPDHPENSQLEEIGAYAFAYNKGFDYIYIPETVSKIGSYVFNYTNIGVVCINNYWLANISASAYRLYFTDIGEPKAVAKQVYVSEDVVYIDEESFLNSLYTKDAQQTVTGYVTYTIK